MSRNVLAFAAILAVFTATRAQRWEYHHDGPGHLNDEIFHTCAVEDNGSSYFGGVDRHNTQNSNFIVVGLSAAGAERWVDNDSAGKVEDICVGEDGFIYAVGTIHTVAGNTKFTVACYHRNGTRRWQYKARSADDYNGLAIAVCPRTGNGVYVCGWVDYPDYWYQFTVVALDSSGNEVWMDTLGAPGLTPDKATDIAVGMDGNLYVSGNLSPDTVYPEGAVVSITDSGDVRWRAWPDIGPACIAAGGDGNVYVGGQYEDSLGKHLCAVSLDSAGTRRWHYFHDAGGGRGALDLDHAKDIVWGDGNVYIGGQGFRESGFIDAFIISLEPDGDERWHYWFRGDYNYFNWVNELVFTPDGYIHGAGLMCSLISSIAEWCLSPDGDTMWVFKRNSEGPNSASAQCIGCDAAGNVYLGGSRFTDTRDCWAGSLSRPHLNVGGNETDHAYAVALTPDSGYVVAGMTRSFGAGRDDGYLIRLNQLGDTMWTRTFGGTNTDQFQDVTLTSDGGYVLAGHKDNDPWLLKVDSAGEQVWSQVYSVPHFGGLFSVLEMPDHGFITVGNCYNGADYMHGLAIGTDSLGNEVWRTEVGTGSEYSLFADVVECGNGDWLVVGRYKSTPMGNGDAWVIRLNSSGDTLWTKTHGGSSDDYADAVIATSDGGYVQVVRTRTLRRVDAEAEPGRGYALDQRVGHCRRPGLPAGHHRGGGPGVHRDRYVRRGKQRPVAARDRPQREPVGPAAVRRADDRPRLRHLPDQARRLLPCRFHSFLRDRRVRGRIYRADGVRGRCS